MEPMKLNGLERKVEGCEPTRTLPGKYIVDVNLPTDIKELDSEAFLEMLDEEGLSYTGIIKDILYGFNDRRRMGYLQAYEAGEQGRSTVWIGLNQKIAELEVVPRAVKSIGSKNMQEYAQRILEIVVTFVEDETNYSNQQ
jgi:hypothetical protein